MFIIDYKYLYFNYIEFRSRFMFANYIKSKFLKISKRKSYKCKYSIKDSYTKIIDFFRFNHINTDIVIVCIGTNRTDTVDCLGPFVGSILREDKNFNIPVYGSMINPINAINLKTQMNTIKDKHPSETIIAIDAALSDKSKIGMIDIKRGAIKPGKGAGIDLLEVGDISIKAFVAPVNIDVMKYGSDLSFISEMAYAIAKGLKESFDENNKIL